MVRFVLLIMTQTRARSKLTLHLCGSAEIAHDQSSVYGIIIRGIGLFVCAHYLYLFARIATVVIGRPAKCLFSKLTVFPKLC